MDFMVSSWPSYALCRCRLWFFKVLNFLALTWCRRHSLNHTIVFIVFLFPVVMEFYCVIHQVRAKFLCLNFLESVMSGSNFQTQGMNNTTSTLSNKVTKKYYYENQSLNHLEGKYLFLWNVYHTYLQVWPYEQH